MEENIEQFIEAEKKRVEKLYSTKHKLGFPDRQSFSNWYVRQLLIQKFACFYCSTSVFDIQRLITFNLLRTRKTGYGVRGPVLEIDRMINKKGYRAENCVLSCYYCNNDKSYTIDSSEYSQYFGNSRQAYFKALIQRIPLPKPVPSNMKKDFN